MFDDNDNSTGIALGVVLAVAAALLFGVVMYAVKAGAPVPAPNATTATPAAAASDTRPLALGTLGFAVANGKVTLSGTAPDEARKMRLVNQAALLFGIENVVNNITIDPAAESRRWKGKSLDLMTKLKSLGEFNLDLDGKTDTINFKGAVASDAAKAELMTWLSTFFKENSKVNVDVDINSELANLAPQNPSLMFNEIIEFASGSAEIPATNKVRLSLIAGVLKEDGRKLGVIGHTDNQGNAEANRELSIKRAEAVKAFLVEQGIAAENLTAGGMGHDQPVADNNTPEGRQKNRRIEFLQ
jgi:OOP family OmpA-OmpF porin